MYFAVCGAFGSWEVGVLGLLMGMSWVGVYWVCQGPDAFEGIGAGLHSIVWRRDVIPKDSIRLYCILGNIQHLSRS